MIILVKYSTSQACPLSPGNCILTWLFQELPCSHLTQGRPTNTFSKIITFEIQVIEALSPLVGKAVRCKTKGMYFSAHGKSLFTERNRQDREVNCDGKDGFSRCGLLVTGGLGGGGQGRRLLAGCLLAWC